VKAFVTGGTGFIGTHLVNALLARGDQVTCLVRTRSKATALGSGVRVIQGDLDDPDALRAGCNGADVVFHIAGRIAARDLREFMQANRDGTANVLEAAAVAPPSRFVYVSSLAAAGPTVAGRPIDETRPPAPVTPYGQSKLAGEVLVRAMPFPWSIVRPPMVYGEGDRTTFGIFQLANRGIVPLVGDGSQELSAIHVADLITALLAIPATDRTARRVYFAAHPEITTARELARAVGRALGRTPRLVVVPATVARVLFWTVGSLARLAGRAAVLSADRAEEFLAPAWTCRVDALRADAGWDARLDLATGLARTAAWYRQEGWLG